MDSLEIKHEFEWDSRLQCRSCLSIGRKLAPLAKYTSIYMKLTADVLHPNFLTQPIEICWECQSLLRKVILFQKQVKKAYELLLNNQNFHYGPLSNLASITLNDNHYAVYLNEYNVQKYTSSTKNNCILLKDNIVEKDTVEQSQIRMLNENVFHKKNFNSIKLDKNSSNIKNLSNFELNRQDSCTNIHKVDMSMRKENATNAPPLNERSDYAPSDNNNISCDINKEIRNEHNIINNVNVHQENTSEEDDVNDFSFGTSNVKPESKSKKTKSRWAMTRSAQNKKPKFKIVSTNIAEDFTKVQISDDELAEYMAKERDSEYYKSKRFKCDTCILGFVEEKEWLRHTEKHHSNKLSAFTCNICKARFDHKSHLLGHIMGHYIVYKCKICLYICRNEETRVRHFQSEHKKVFRCLKCDLKFSNRRDFFKHYKDWHEKYVCDHCGVSFKMRYCIKDHIRKRHSPFNCVPCNKTFARYNGLWLHNKLDHSPLTAPAYCVECDTRYKDIYRYKWHLCNSAKHSPKKKLSIPCPDCEKKFTKKIYMKDHYNLVHLNLVKHRCEQCDKNFIRNAELVKHRRRKHEGILPPKNKICYLCGRGFTTNKILRNHVKTHRDITDRQNKEESNIKSY